MAFLKGFKKTKLKNFFRLISHKRSCVADAALVCHVLVNLALPFLQALLYDVQTVSLHLNNI